MININLLFCDEDDFGFNVLLLIFDNIQLSKMILLTTKNNEKIIDCFNRIKKGINYILHFKPHNIKNPLLNTFKCEHFGVNSVVISDFKNNILKEVSNEIFDVYKNSKVYIELIELINLLKDN